MTFIDEFLVGTAFPAVRAAAVWPVALHAVTSRAARARNDVPVKTAVHALQGIHLDGPEIGVVDAGIAVGP